MILLINTQMGGTPYILRTYVHNLYTKVIGIRFFGSITHIINRSDQSRIRLDLDPRVYYREVET